MVGTKLTHTSTNSFQSNFWGKEEMSTNRLNWFGFKKNKVIKKKNLDQFWFHQNKFWLMKINLNRFQLTCFVFQNFQDKAKKMESQARLLNSICPIHVYFYSKCVSFYIVVYSFQKKNVWKNINQKKITLFFFNFSFH